MHDEGRIWGPPVLYLILSLNHLLSYEPLEQNAKKVNENKHIHTFISKVSLKKGVNKYGIKPIFATEVKVNLISTVQDP